MVLDHVAAVFLLQWCMVFNSFTGLLCGPPRDSSFLSGARTSSRIMRYGRRTSAQQEVAFIVKLCRQSVELCDVHVACKCICYSHRMYCLIFEPFASFTLTPFFCFFKCRALQVYVCRFWAFFSHLIGFFCVFLLHQMTPDICSNMKMLLCF